MGSAVDRRRPVLRLLDPPVLRDGRMEAPREAAGFGKLVNPEWIAEQDVDDPDHLLVSLLSYRLPPG